MSSIKDNDPINDPINDPDEEFATTSFSGSKVPVRLGDDSTLNLSKMYQNWFLDYASYVILERAVPISPMD